MFHFDKHVKNRLLVVCYNMFMTKVADVLIALYKIALPFCQRRKISLNLDLADPSLALDIDARRLKNQLNPYLQSAILRTEHGAITIGAYAQKGNAEIFIKDTGSSLSKNQRAIMMDAAPNLHVHSRHGYGTTVTLQYPIPNVAQ